ncbi:Isochorismatase-like protein [Sporodiniella umbellata]|nr:Isochorismatase-like protein [Sporodiniella umbellata]
MDEKTALIVVDLQNDFMEGGSLGIPNSFSIIKPVNEIIQYIKSKGGLVIATQDWHAKDHISFASNHHNKSVFDVIQIEHSGIKLEQTLWPDHCVENTMGVEIYKQVDSKYFDYIVKKGINSQVDSYSAFMNNSFSEVTELPKILYQNLIEKVVVVGLAADYCVKHTALDAVKFGFKTVIINEAVEGTSRVSKETALELLKSKGVVIQSISDVIH